MPENMDCVVVFDPDDSDEETANKWIGWLRRNKSSALVGKYVPGVEETQKYLNEMWRHD